MAETDMLRGLMNKLNFAMASKFLKEKEIIEEYLDFPKDRKEEEESVRKLIYFFLKRVFVGCRLRANNQTFTVRLDGHVHKKIRRLKELIIDNHEWSKWFRDNHNDIYREMRNIIHRDFGYRVDFRKRNDKEFIYVPTSPDNIQEYRFFGLLELFKDLHRSYERELLYAGYYNRVVSLMEQEVERRKEKTRKIIENEQRKYTEFIKNSLLEEITSVNENDKSFEGRLHLKLYKWCTEKGIKPSIAHEATYDRVIPVGINVDIICKDEEKEEDWCAVPIFGGYEIPEGYHLIDGYGEVTGYDTENERSRNGQSPIVVIKYMYLEYREEFWKNHFPPHYYEVLEATRRFKEEVEKEIAEEKEKEESLTPLDPDQKAGNEAIADTVESFRRQLASHLNDPEVKVERTAGIYVDKMGIPLERFVAVFEDESHRFATISDASVYLKTEKNFDPVGTYLRDYHNPEKRIYRIG